MKTLKDNGRKLVDDFNGRWRDGEDALLRLANNASIPGDGVRLAAVGLDDPGRQKTELDRLRAVKAQLEKAGSIADFRKARDTFHEVAPRVEIELKEINAKLAELGAQQEKAIQRKEQLSSELESADADLKAKIKARDVLRSQPLLPRHIVAEINSRRSAVSAKTAERQQELIGSIRHLTADAGRLAGQTDRAGKIENEKMLKEFAERATANEKHRAHEFWRDRVFSLSEWLRFEAWAVDRANAMQEELDGLTQQVVRELEDETEKLVGFYTDAIE